MKNLFDRARLFFSKDKEFRSALYQIMGFCPHNIDLYRTAFAHKSHEYRSKKTGNKPLNNERLEFLGDAVLETVVSHIVYRQYPNKREGFLTNTRSKIVSRESLGKLAKELGIDRLIQSQTHGRTHNSYLEGNSFEALMGAIYLDRGFRYAFQFIEKRIIGAVLDLDTVANKEVNFKSKLLEWKQKNRIHLDFVDNISNNSNSTSPSFHTTVVIEGIPAGEGKGFSKKESHQAAAKDALTQMRRDADFLDAMFRAKEKRTAMGAEEFFALPHISEIDEQIAKERSGAKNERNNNRSERNERKNERKNEKAERNERKERAENSEREERNNNRKNDNAIREEKRNERKSDKEERKNERGTPKANREERNNNREERANQREERNDNRKNDNANREEKRNDHEDRTATSVEKEERKERNEQKTVAPREVKAKKAEVAAEQPGVKVEAMPEATEQVTEKLAKMVVAVAETKSEMKIEAGIPAPAPQKKPATSQANKPSNAPSHEVATEEVSAPVAEKPQPKAPQLEATATLIPVELEEVAQSEDNAPSLIVEASVELPQSADSVTVASEKAMEVVEVLTETPTVATEKGNATHKTTGEVTAPAEEILPISESTETPAVAVPEIAEVAPQTTEVVAEIAVAPNAASVAPVQPSEELVVMSATPEASAAEASQSSEEVAIIYEAPATTKAEVATPTEEVVASLENTAPAVEEPASVNEEAAPRVRSEQEKKRARRQNKRQNAAAFTNTTLPPAEQSHRAQKAERKLQEQAEKHKAESRQRQVKKVQQELAETFKLDVDIDDFMVVDTTPANETASPQANEPTATKANEATNTPNTEEKRKNNRSRGGRRGGNNRRRGGNRSNTSQGESKEGGKSAPTAAHNSQEA